MARVEARCPAENEALRRVTPLRRGVARDRLRLVSQRASAAPRTPSPGLDPVQRPIVEGVALEGKTIEEAAHLCCSTRDVLDVFQVLPPLAVDRAAEAFPSTYERLLEKLGKASGTR